MAPTIPRGFFGVNRPNYRTGVLLMAALVLCCVVITKAQDPVTKTVKISFFNQACFDSKKQEYLPYNYAGWVVKIGDQSFTLDANGQASGSLTLTKGTTYSLDVVTPDGEEPVQLANYNQVIYDSPDKVNGTFLDSKPGRDGNVRLHLYDSWAGETPQQPQLRVYVGGFWTKCGEETKHPKEYKASVLLKTLECDKTDFSNYSVKIDGNEVKLNTIFGAYDVPIKEGRIKIRISVPDYPDAKIHKASVVGHGGKGSFDKNADELGQIELMLEPDLFTGKPVDPYYPQITIHLYTVGDCPPSYEPPLQRLGAPPGIKVVSVQGEVTVHKENSEESLVTVGSMIEDQQIIYTRFGARAELVASDKSLYIFEEATVAKFIMIKKPDDTWIITIELRARQPILKHVRYDRHGLKGFEWKIVTPTAIITNKGTVYTVTYNEDSKSTTVGVEEGQVTITPTNTSLNPFTLAAHQMVDIFENRVSSISPFNPADPKGSLPKESGGLFNRPLLLVGIGGAALIGLLVLGAGITFLYRRANLATPQRLGSVASPSVATNVATNVPSNEWRCPNPQCGKLVPAGKKFCTACGGTQSGVRVAARPVSVASPAVATSERRCPNPQCGKLVPAAKKFCTACGTSVI